MYTASVQASPTPTSARLVHETNQLEHGLEILAPDKSELELQTGTANVHPKTLQPRPVRWYSPPPPLFHHQAVSHQGLTGLQPACNGVRCWRCGLPPPPLLPPPSVLGSQLHRRTRSGSDLQHSGLHTLSPHRSPLTPKPLNPWPPYTPEPWAWFLDGWFSTPLPWAKWCRDRQALLWQVCMTCASVSSGGPTMAHITKRCAHSKMGEFSLFPPSKVSFRYPRESRDEPRGVGVEPTPATTGTHEVSPGDVTGGFRSKYWGVRGVCPTPWGG